jgi:hypothetical protein
VPAEIVPPELANLVDFSERPRTGDWSLRAALCRYAQPQPARVSRVLDSVRRIEWALQSQRGVLEKEGQAIWSEVDDGRSPATGPHAPLVELLRVTAALDGLGDALAEWAVARAVPRPDDLVDEVTGAVEERLDEMGLPREERTRPPRGRGGRGV